MIDTLFLEKHYSSIIMKVNSAFILAAGFGTRMGEIGKILPKVLWPVFAKRVIDLQISFIKSIGITEIYLNAHYLSLDIKFYIKKHHPEVHVLIEDDILDVGGGILNFAHTLNYKGNALIVNGDQFLYFDYKQILNSVVDLEDVILFGTNENSSAGYNRLDLKDERLISITKNMDIPRNEKLITYSGLSLINLETLDRQQGELKFFETVANYNKKTVKVKILENYEYWDFGTVDRYIQSSFDVIYTENKFKAFLERHGALDFQLCKITPVQIKLQVDSEDFVITKKEIKFKSLRSISALN
jgi:NDP-sugar pyrophosphorylase family protein